MTVATHFRSIPVPDVSPAEPDAPAAMPRLLDVRVIAGAAAVIAGLSLFVSRSPAYDVWTWQLWGREFAHGDLVTSFGPQFKPLPVFVAALSAPFGSAAVPIWMFLAHAAGVLGVGAVARLAWRAAGPGAAAIGAAGLLASYQFTFYLLPYGMSEPMLIAFAFWAIDRHLDGHARSAYVLVFGAALLRPEVWPFLLAYSGLLIRGRQVSRAFLAALLVLAPAAWFLPEWWGSGDPFRSGSGKILPGGPLTQAHPGLAVLANTADGLLPFVWLGAVIAVGFALRSRNRILLGYSAIAVAWLAIVAVLTEIGSSTGVTRYLVITQAMMCVLAGAGWVLLIRLVGSRLGNWSLAKSLIAPVVLVAIIGPSLGTVWEDIRKGVTDVRYQQGAYLATARAVARAGGKRVLGSCGSFVWSAPFREPELAYLLHKHLVWARSELTPDLTLSVAAGPVVRISVRGKSTLLPSPLPLQGYHEVGKATANGVTAVVLSPC